MRGGFDLWVGEDALDKELSIHSSILAQEIPWTEESGGLQSIGSQKSRTQLSDNNLLYKQVKKNHMIITTDAGVFDKTEDIFIKTPSRLKIEGNFFNWSMVSTKTLQPVSMERKAMPKSVQTITQLHSFHMLTRSCSKSSHLGFSCT